MGYAKSGAGQRQSPLEMLWHDGRITVEKGFSE